jgi:hypothetical protein
VFKRQRSLSRQTSGRVGAMGQRSLSGAPLDRQLQGVEMTSGHGIRTRLGAAGARVGELLGAMGKGICPGRFQGGRVQWSGLWESHNGY